MDQLEYVPNNIQLSKIIYFYVLCFRKKGKNAKFSHLTNFSINKFSEKFEKPTKQDDDDGVKGNKWSFRGLKKKYTQMGVDYDKVFKKIHDIIVKTIIAAEGNVQA